MALVARGTATLNYNFQRFLLSYPKWCSSKEGPGRDWFLIKTITLRLCLELLFIRTQAILRERYQFEELSPIYRI
jgi:hypothetical protein